MSQEKLAAMEKKQSPLDRKCFIPLWLELYMLLKLLDTVNFSVFIGFFYMTIQDVLPILIVTISGYLVVMCASSYAGWAIYKQDRRLVYKSSKIVVISHLVYLLINTIRLILISTEDTQSQDQPTMNQILFLVFGQVSIMSLLGLTMVRMRVFYNQLDSTFEQECQLS